MSLPISSPRVETSQRFLETGALVAAALLGVIFLATAYQALGALSWDYDEGWYILGGRFIGDGLRPFVDYAYLQPPLHLYLLALAGKLFGATLVGYRILSLASVAGSGFLLFLLVRSVAGFGPALAAQALFLFAPPQVHALGAISESPMLFFALLGAVFLFVGSSRASAYASGVAFVVALLIKPTCLVMVAAAVLSLAFARSWQRLGDLAVSGLVASVASLAWILVASNGVFAEVLRFQILERLGTRTTGMWSISAGFSEIRTLLGVDTHWQMAVYCLKQFYNFPASSLPIALLGLSLLGLPVWVVRCGRERPALAAFAVLWPLSCFLLNFFGMDFVSAKYFVPFLAFSSFLLAGLVWLVQPYVPTLVAAAIAAVALAGMVGYFSAALKAGSDPSYFRRAEWLAGQHDSLVSFSPMFFAASGAPAGCGLWNPPLIYGNFGDMILGADESMRRFRLPSEKLIECLRAQPATSLVIDFWYYFFVRPGDPLGEYLHGEGKAQRLFFSPWAERRWNDSTVGGEGTQR